MNFDTYKIKDELLEIYSGSEETFCVGKNSVQKQG